VDSTIFHTDLMNRRMKPQAEVQKTVDMVVSGTKAVIEGAKACGVKRFVMTSSLAAMIPAGWCEATFPIPDVQGAYDPMAHNKTISEATWTDLKIVQGYLTAKTLSEMEAWKLVDGHKMELVTLSPGYVLGPQLNKPIWADSVFLIDVAMRQTERSLPAIPSILAPAADVRDVAKAHVKAMLLPEAAGQRYLLATDVFNAQQMSQFLYDTFQPMGYNVNARMMPKCIAGVVGCCDPLIFRIHRNWDKFPKLDTAKWKRDLVPKPIGLNQSILETVHSAVKTGRYESRAKFVVDQPEYQGSTGAIQMQATLA